METGSLTSKLKIMYWMMGLLICASIVVIIFFFMLGGDFIFTLWADRDLTRTASMFEYLPVTGAELSYGMGARLPGGLFHYILALPMAFSADPVLVHRFILVLSLIGASAVLFVAGKKYAGGLGAAAAILFLVSSPVTYGNVVKLWNPAAVGLFGVLAFYLFLSVCVDRNESRLKWALFVIALGAQLHLSIALLVLPFIVTIALFRVRVPLQTILWGVALMALAYAPYIVSEVMNGFFNTKLLFGGQAQTGGDYQGRYNVIDVSALALGKYYLMLRDQFLAFDTFNTPGSGFKLMAEFGLLCLSLAVSAIAVGTALCLASVRKLRGSSPASLADPLDGRKMRALWASVIYLVGCTIYYTFDQNIILSTPSASRYLFLAVPPAAFLVGAGIQFGADAIAARVPTAGFAAVMSVLTASLLLQGATAVQRIQQTAADQQSFSTWRAYSEFFDFTRDSLGWSSMETAAKGALMVSRNAGANWHWFSGFPSNYILKMDGHEPSGRETGDCVAVLEHWNTYDPPPVGSPERLAKISAILKHNFPLMPGELEILGDKPLGPHLAVTYRTPTERCFSSFSNRYVLTELEREALVNGHTHPVGSVWAYTVPGEIASSRLIRAARDFYMSITPIQDDAGRITALELGSNQLRGTAYNSGFYFWQLVDNLSLSVASADGSETAIDIPSPVGGQARLVGGYFTPIQISLNPPVQPGARVTLTGRYYPNEYAKRLLRALPEDLRLISSLNDLTIASDGSTGTVRLLLGDGKSPLPPLTPDRKALATEKLLRVVVQHTEEASAFAPFIGKEMYLIWQSGDAYRTAASEDDALSGQFLEISGPGRARLRLYHPFNYSMDLK